MIKTLSISLAVFLLSANALAADAARATVIGPVSNIVVAADAQGPASDDCPAFKVTPAQVASFLRRAVLITGAQAHDWFLHGPCYAKGTLKNRYGSWTWELRNMGTATLVSASGEAFLLSDPRQQSPLSEDGQ